MGAVLNAVLATIPSPDQGVWYLGPLPIRAYALCIIAGIIVAIWWGERRWVARGGIKGEVTDIAVWAVPFGLVGGRLYHVITDNQKYFGPGKNPLAALEIWNGGLGIWGAIALGAVGAWIGCRRKGIPLPAMADALAPGIVVAQAIGRLGNYFNQELYGGDTTLPWGLEIYRRVTPEGREDALAGVARQPRRGTGHRKLREHQHVAVPEFDSGLGDEAVMPFPIAVLQRVHRFGNGRRLDGDACGAARGFLFQLTHHRRDAGRKGRQYAELRPCLEGFVEHRFVGLQHRDLNGCTCCLDCGTKG